MDLRNKNAIVTGGAKGIGKSLAEKLLDEGATVGIFDIDREGLDKLKKEKNGVYCKVCDVTDHKQTEAAVEEFYNEFKHIDILVNNASFVYNSPLISLTSGGIKKHSIDMWNKVITTDLSSIFYVTLNVALKMISDRTKGVIANVSSVCASGNPGQGAYSAAKAGVNALTRTWAKELGPLGIRVIGLAPGYTDTDTTKTSVSESVLRDYIRRVPLKRLGKRDEIAEGIISLIKNDFFNGKVFELDGGLVI